MPVVSFEYDDLITLLGRRVPKTKIAERLPMLGCSIEQANAQWDVEFFPDRVDCFSVEGVARALRSFLGYAPGLRRYPVKRSDVRLIVEPVDIRPYVAGALVHLPLNDVIVRSIIDLQEKLHQTIGRNRKKMAIGLHDFSAVTPPITYKPVDPGYRFVPLGADREMSLRKILKRHEKGIAYAPLLEGAARYPLLVDAKEEVLSFPPVINGTLTRIIPQTKELFIDVTGTDDGVVARTMAILVSALAERGGDIKAVGVYENKAKKGDKYKNKSKSKGVKWTPNLEPTPYKLEARYAQSLLSPTLSREQMIEGLQRMGLSAVPSPDGDIDVLVPAYRADVLHPIDLVEDIAIGYGYERFTPCLPREPTWGRELEVEDQCTECREAMIGLGFQEVVTPTLVDPSLQTDETGVEILNPIASYGRVRGSIIPSLLGVLRANRDQPTPQAIFEIGDVVYRGRNVRKMAAARIHSKASFTEAKSIVQSLLGDGWDPKESKRVGFIDGRCASIVAGKKEVGYFGELHPRMITGFELGQPVIAIEMTVGDHWK